MRKRRRGLGSPPDLHRGHAEAALAHARRFVKAAESTTATCEARLQSVIAARNFADLAVHEAAHARTSREGGPSRLQIESSAVADAAINAQRVVIHHCSRGYARFSTKPKKTKAKRGRR